MQTGSNDISLFDHDAYQDMNAWFRTPLGEKLLTTERRIVENMLSRRFGYHLLQLGCAELVLHDSSPMGHKFSFCAFPEAGTCHNAIARGEEIPLGSESVDLVLLHHALDFSDQQHQLLREVSRILIAGGHVIIVGFNPISSWGIRNKLLWWKQQKPPWHASLLSSLRLTDWLKLLDFQVDQVKYGCYTLPVNSPAVIRYSSFLERLADRLNWPTGGIYTIVARKQVIPYYSYSAAAPALAYAWAGHANPGQDFAGIQEFPRSQQRRSRPIMPAEVKIYTDGACRGNPGPGGWGAVLEYGTESKLLHGGEILTTNNRMELMAVIQALSALKRPCKIALVSDSKYVLKGITEWLPNWKQKGWRTAAKKPVMNSDLWQQLDALVSKHEISWHWVKGHSGHVQNELADQLANKGIDELMSGVAQVQVDLP